MLGDIAAGTGADLSELAKIYGQVKTKGILQTERFNQFLDRSINLTKALAKVTGSAESEIGDLMSSGEVSFSDFNKAMQSLVTSGGTFENMMIKLSSTTEGKMSTMKDAYSEMQKAFGKPLLPSIQSALDELTKTFEALEPELSAAGERFGGFLEESFKAAKFKVEPSYFDDLANAMKLSLAKIAKDSAAWFFKQFFTWPKAAPNYKEFAKFFENILDFGFSIFPGKGADAYKVAERLSTGRWQTAAERNILLEQDPQKYLSKVNQALQGPMGVGEQTRMSLMKSLFKERFGVEVNSEMLQKAVSEPYKSPFDVDEGLRIIKSNKFFGGLADFFSKATDTVSEKAADYLFLNPSTRSQLNDPEVNQISRAWGRVFPLKSDTMLDANKNSLSQLWNNANTPLLLNPAQSGSELNGDLYRTVFKDLLDVNKKIETNTGALRNYSTFK